LVVRVSGSGFLSPGFGFDAEGPAALVRNAPEALLAVVTGLPVEGERAAAVPLLRRQERLDPVATLQGEERAPGEAEAARWRGHVLRVGPEVKRGPPAGGDCLDDDVCGAAVQPRQPAAHHGRGAGAAASGPPGLLGRRAPPPVPPLGPQQLP